MTNHEQAENPFFDCLDDLRRAADPYAGNDAVIALAMVLAENAVKMQKPDVSDATMVQWVLGRVVDSLDEEFAPSVVRQVLADLPTYLKRES